MHACKVALLIVCSLPPTLAPHHARTGTCEYTPTKRQHDVALTHACMLPLASSRQLRGHDARPASRGHQDDDGGQPIPHHGSGSQGGLVARRCHGLLPGCECAAPLPTPTTSVADVPPSLPLSQLIPWAWIEASTKGAVLLFTAAEIEKTAVKSGIGAGSAGLLGGMGGGIAQAYATMGFCTCMKT